ncbi:MAG: nicotinate-nucleotide adenylyltransferase [Tannerellaceae bacterium]|jgi:nicotinate-nucleotide adenylyltransferase|nr:nicotinate-nucleotide adenylyltransferase [Tannerellaceae bacterium]
MKVGVFAGSFNPVHIGHLALANWMCEFGGVDEVCFIVSPHNPLKAEDGLIDGQRRLEWMRMVTAGYPKMSVSDVEFGLPRPSYTVHTLDVMTDAEPEKQFVLLIGSDNWVTFNQWKDYYGLLSRHPVVVIPRPDYPFDLSEHRFARPPEEDIRTVCPPQLEISSSFIRESIRKGRDIRFFLPEAIRNSVVQTFGEQK